MLKLLGGSIDELQTMLHSSQQITIDIETDSLNRRTARVIGIGLCGEWVVPPRRVPAFYIPIYSWDVVGNEFRSENSINEIKSLLQQLIGHKLCTWNGAYDLLVIRNFLGVDLVPHLYCDGMLLCHTVYEDEFDYMLKPTGKRLFGASAVSEEADLKEAVKALGGSWTQENKQMYMAPLEIIAKYCMADCKLTSRIISLKNKELQQHGLEKFFYEDEVMPLYRHFTIPAEANGIRLDMPLLLKSQLEISADIKQIETKILAAIAPHLQIWKKWFFDKEFPPRRSGEFLQGYCELYAPQLPKTKSGAYSTAASAISILCAGHPRAVIAGEAYMTPDEVAAVQNLLWEANGRPWFNLQSKHHLKKLFFDSLKEKPLNTTPTGQPKADDEFLEAMAAKYEWADWLRTYNKLNKLKSTYMDRFIDAQENGYFYPSFQQHRTVSGRLAGDLQQLPRPIENPSPTDVVAKYTNLIRAFFIAREGHTFIDDDYESAEPRVFAHISKEERLRDIFRNGWDFYSTICIATENLTEYSPDKKAANYLGKLNKQKRQDSKVYCFSKDTLVTTNKGPVPIQDLSPGDEVLTRKGWQPILNTFKRQAKTITVHTNRGILECTPDHKFFANEKWIKAGSLQPGMRLVEEPKQEVAHGAHKNPLPIYSNMSFRNGAVRPIGHLNLTPAWAYIIGAIIGDGIISINQTPNKHGHGLKGYVGICGDPKDGVVAHVAQFFKDIGFTAQKPRKKGNCETIVWANSELCKIFYDTLQLGDMTAPRKVKNLKVPDYIFTATQTEKIAFLAGILDTDGYVKQFNNTRICVLTSKDHRLTSGCIMLLRTLGISAIMEPQWNKTYKRWYWTMRIPVVGMKQLSDLGIKDYMVVDRKKTAFEKAIVRQNRALKLAAVTRVEQTNKIDWVYDIKVKNAPEFFANGILVHNCLGIPYGLGGYKLQFELNIPLKDAEKLVAGFWTSHPSLKQQVDQAHKECLEQGFVVTEAGRVRHLSRAKTIYAKYGNCILDDLELWKALHEQPGLYQQAKKDRRELKNLLNNAFNVKVQGLVASIINRAAIKIAKRYAVECSEAKLIANIHDELIAEAPVNVAKQAAAIMQEEMEKAWPLSIPMIAVPSFGTNFRDAKN